MLLMEQIGLFHLGPFDLVPASGWLFYFFLVAAEFTTDEGIFRPPVLWGTVCSWTASFSVWASSCCGFWVACSFTNYSCNKRFFLMRVCICVFKAISSACIAWDVSAAKFSTNCLETHLAVMAAGGWALRLS